MLRNHASYVFYTFSDFLSDTYDAGAVQKPSDINLINNPKEFLGISNQFGFTKKNELFVGRVAMLGFAAELIGEVAQGGKGPLGQLGALVLSLLKYSTALILLFVDYVVMSWFEVV